MANHVQKINENYALFRRTVKTRSVVLKKQIEILEYALSAGVDFGLVLRNNNMIYDDLRYECDDYVYDGFRPLRGLKDYTVKPNGIPVVSFFAGAGGADLGFEAAGYEHIALIEMNRIFCDTIRQNRPKWNIIGPPDYSGDVSNIEDIESTLRHTTGLSKMFDGVFVGGPPCQPFSIAANQRFNRAGENFKRVGYAHTTNGNLLFKYIELIIKFRPKAFLIENVPGLVDVDGGVQIREAIGKLLEAGYKVEEPFIINAANYNIPQQRVRLFIVGSRLKSNFNKPVMSKDLIPCEAVLTGKIDRVENHITRQHKAESILRYMKLTYGERDHLGRVDRLNPQVPAKTVIAGGVAGGGRSHLHPRIPRTLSVRECARLQTFPDDYVFTGPSARQFTQVGNAVPPVLAAQLATAIRRSYFS